MLTAGVCAALVWLAVAPGPARPDPVREAQRHFDLGLSLYQEGDLRGALVEFKRAHEVFPNYRVLYNLGVVARELHDWAGALRHYREYLDRGGDWIPADRRLQVERTVVELADRIARLEIAVAGGPAEVTLDERPVPEAEARRPITVNPGRHRVRVSYPQRAPLVRVVELASGESARLAFEPTGRRPAAGLPRAAAAPAPAGNRLGLAADPRPSVAPARRSARWTWAAAGLAAAGAVTTALLARDASQALASERSSYPASAGRVQELQMRTRIYAMTADGLTAGAAVLAVVSLYLTFTTSSARGDDARAALATAGAPGWAWSF
jgi:hypothetical protein